MAKEEWGTKRLCPTTGKRFYDLNRNPIVSPYTGEVVEVDASKTRMIAADAEDAVTAKAKKAKATDDDDAVLEEDDDSDVDVELDDDILDDDDDEDNVSLDEIADVASEEDES
ncbi:MAG: TIGR02300 family protein [Pseudomonadota bacterium]